MENDIMTRDAIQNLYHASAKQLYNLALYTVGDKSLAEQATVRAFSDAFSRIGDKSDVNLFERHCFRLLYEHGKKALRMSEDYIGRVADDRLTELLIGLSFEERYILLLFCWHKYSVHEIAKTTRLPQFMIEKRLNAAVNKAAPWIV